MCFRVIGEIYEMLVRPHFLRLRLMEERTETMAMQRQAAAKMDEAIMALSKNLLTLELSSSIMLLPRSTTSDEFSFLKYLFASYATPIPAPMAVASSKLITCVQLYVLIISLFFHTHAHIRFTKVRN